jgi:hypothetical protein
MKILKSISLLLIVLFITSIPVSAWNCLIAQNWDVIDVSKWNELIKQKEYIWGFFLNEVKY